MSTTLNGVAYAAQISAAAFRHHIDPRLLAAVAAQETGGPGANSGRNVVGDAGHGRGLFQIDDRYHAFARSAAAMNPAQNADYAAGLLSGLLARYHGNVRAALSAYNAGDPAAPGTTTQWPDGQRLCYADSVLRHYGALGGPALPERSTSPMSFLGHIVHGLESGVTALVTTGNPYIAAGAGILGAVAPDPQAMPAAAPPMTAPPLVNSLRSESQTEQQNVNSLSQLAELIAPSAE